MDNQLENWGLAARNSYPPTMNYHLQVPVSQLVVQLWGVVGSFGGEPQLEEADHYREDLMSYYSPVPDDHCFLLSRDRSIP